MISTKQTPPNLYTEVGLEALREALREAMETPLAECKPGIDIDIEIEIDDLGFYIVEKSDFINDEFCMAPTSTPTGHGYGYTGAVYEGGQW